MTIQSEYWFGYTCTCNTCAVLLGPGMLMQGSINCHRPKKVMPSLQKLFTPYSFGLLFKFVSHKGSFPLFSMIFGLLAIPLQKNIYQKVPTNNLKEVVCFHKQDIHSVGPACINNLKCIYIKKFYLKTGIQVNSGTGNKNFCTCFKEVL